MSSGNCSGEKSVKGGAGNSSSGKQKDGKSLNAEHLERRRRKRKFIVKKLEKKLELYHRQIKRCVGSWLNL